MGVTSIKTLVFDLGGVYFTRGTYICIKKIEDIYKIKEHHLLREYFFDGYKKEGYLLRLGLITMDEFEERFIAQFNISEYNINHIRYLWFGSFVPYYRMEDVIKKLKEKNFRLIVFSGNIRERIEFLDKRYGFSNYFDDFVYSFEYQKNKGDIEFYNELLNHLECEPNEAIIIDDERKNIELASSVGLNGILYYYTEQLVHEFKKYDIHIDF
ncbi:MAG: HAD-IA family hydrolase [Promethearchaeota archaeon]